ncbi:MAG: SHOCT domain-containing protein [Chitinophagaceae bacterium]|nr:SHOCT domain-containing protein [Chitinophagaceae bacterium]
MKKLIAIIICTPILGFSQTPDEVKPGMSASDIKKMLNDGYTLSSGWTIKEGDTLRLGPGTMPDKRYAYIYQSPLNFFATASADNSGKNYLASNAARNAIVKEFITYGTKRSGFTIIAKVGVGDISNYWIEIDNAIGSGELTPPAMYSSFYKKTSGPAASIADELKKWKDLLDAGAITKEEYEAQKKKLIGQ